ncbi:Inherit from KOG: Ankyrin Repeat Protein [Seminavis robusta]|uniref:Inherit from KOG: Ankyrin Repeat Protein n=1 Tax=Seminavis robusta TaxID=568900 RepID=A0A9N8HJS2_9STRA|nr:Inherit from KOG: Ankyrin Repeat Protein [Seminavis robusta]|eukprot:Sro569_g168280.1 Inherit from KOG: Ankyrin Repeat Protein (385) ;mRNA; r:11577-12731
MTSVTRTNVDGDFYNALDRSDTPPSLDEIQWIVHADPGVTTRYVLLEDCQTPLYRACLKEKVHSHVIDYLIAQWPDSVRLPEKHGDLPIHAACKNGLDISVIKELVSRFPESVGKKGSSLGTPLHFAAVASLGTSGPSLEVVRFLHETYPEAIQEKDEEGSLPIHNAALAADGIGEQNGVVRFIADAYPESLLAEDDCGNLPLHCACGGGLQLSTVRFLVELAPQSLHHRNKYGDLPLRWALLNKSDASVQILDYLISLQPDLHEPEILHWCYGDISAGNPLLVEYLIQKFPQCVQVQDENGQIPLHKVAYLPFISKKFELMKHAHVTMLVDAYPEGLFVRASNGQTPLEALLNRQCLEETREFMEETMKDILSGSLKNSEVAF